GRRLVEVLPQAQVEGVVHAEGAYVALELSLPLAHTPVRDACSPLDLAVTRPAPPRRAPVAALDARRPCRPGTRDQVPVGGAPSPPFRHRRDRPDGRPDVRAPPRHPRQGARLPRRGDL